MCSWLGCSSQVHSVHLCALTVCCKGTELNKLWGKWTAVKSTLIPQYTVRYCVCKGCELGPVSTHPIMWTVYYCSLLCAAALIKQKVPHNRTYIVCTRVQSTVVTVPCDSALCGERSVCIARCLLAIGARLSRVPEVQNALLLYASALHECAAL